MEVSEETNVFSNQVGGGQGAGQGGEGKRSTRRSGNSVISVDSKGTKKSRLSVISLSSDHSKDALKDQPSKLNNIPSKKSRKENN